MTDQAEDNPLEQLIELFVYAPIGMLYEYPDVLPQLIKKGRSQVQLAKFFGQMATRQRPGSNPSGDASPAQAADVLAKLAARLITEVGSQIGLAPPSGQASSGPSMAVPSEPVAEAESPVDVETDHGLPEQTGRLPIARYDELTAKEIIGLLEDLTHNQLIRVRDHETANRNRKTVLAKIDRLAS